MALIDLHPAARNAMAESLDKFETGDIIQYLVSTRDNVPSIVDVEAVLSWLEQEGFPPALADLVERGPASLAEWFDIEARLAGLHQ